MLEDEVAVSRQPSCQRRANRTLAAVTNTFAGTATPSRVCASPTPRSGSTSDIQSRRCRGISQLQHSSYSAETGIVLEEEEKGWIDVGWKCAGF